MSITSDYQENIKKKKQEIDKFFPPQKFIHKFPRITITNKNSLAYKLNNPGNLKYAGQKEATRGKYGFASFRTCLHGYNALLRQIRKDQSRHLTLKQFIYKYAPPYDYNDTNWFLQYLADKLDYSSNSDINNLNTEKLAAEIAWVESGTIIE